MDSVIHAHTSVRQYYNKNINFSVGRMHPSGVALINFIYRTAFFRCLWISHALITLRYCNFLLRHISPTLFSKFNKFIQYKHNACIPRWNDVETTVSTSFQRGIHVACLYSASAWRTDSFTLETRWVVYAFIKIYLDISVAY